MNTRGEGETGGRKEIKIERKYGGKESREKGREGKNG